MNKVSEDVCQGKYVEDVDYYKGFGVGTIEQHTELATSNVVIGAVVKSQTVSTHDCELSYASDSKALMKPELIV
jgi:hypothetical protein